MVYVHPVFSKYAYTHMHTHPQIPAHNFFKWDYPLTFFSLNIWLFSRQLSTLNHSPRPQEPLFLINKLFPPLETEMFSPSWSRIFFPALLTSHHQHTHRQGHVLPLSWPWISITILSQLPWVKSCPLFLSKLQIIYAKRVWSTQMGISWTELHFRQWEQILLG